MFALLKQLRDIRAAWDAGDIQEAGRLAYELVGDLMGYRGVFSAGEATTEELDECKREVEGIAQAARKPPVGAAGAVGNAALVVTLLQLFGPIVLEWLRRRRSGE